MSRLERMFAPTTSLLVAALALLAFPLRIDAQTSDVVTRSPSPSQSTPTSMQRTPGRGPWQSPQSGGSVAGSSKSTQRTMHNGMPLRASTQSSPHDAYIGSDPDLTRPLVPCDATGETARAKHGARGGYASAGTFGSAAGIGYDPATGLSAARPSIASCFSMLSASRDETSRGRSSGVDERIAPDANSGGMGERRPGALTLLRPFAN